jgi:hypothetical protein
LPPDKGADRGLLAGHLDAQLVAIGLDQLPLGLLIDPLAQAAQPLQTRQAQIAANGMIEEAALLLAVLGH